MASVYSIKGDPKPTVMRPEYAEFKDIRVSLGVGWGGVRVLRPCPAGFWGVVVHPEPAPKPWWGGAGFAPEPQNKATILYQANR